MNKELYIRKEESLKELQKLRVLVSCLQTFLEKNEKNFKREESIEALEKIRTYFEINEKEYHESESKYREVEMKLYSTCNHEVAVKRSNYFCYECLICNRILESNRDKVPENSLISIDTTKDYEVAGIIEEIFKEVVHSDKDLIEEISDAIEEMQYDRDIKVYWRSR